MGFNAAYVGERDKIGLINELRSQPIAITPFEPERQRGYFDYVFEDLDTFRESKSKSLRLLRAQT
ncbi:hypothetical protein [Massilia niastensis]|uniref:hypothetical protein n=1 Tax=Massilia niastensis TaxID=544911 RepID=UPI0003721AA4|nr:hypothetical protein [Massilia niastensis]